MRFKLYLVGIVGLALATALIAWQGFSVVYESLAAAGWGLVVVALFHLLPMSIDTLGWRAVLKDPRRPPFTAMLWMLWVREAIDALLPFAQVGGQVVGTRLLMLYRVSGAAAGASVVLELTLSVATQLLFTLLGLGLLLLLIEHDASFTLTVIAGVCVGGATTAGFILVQKRGLFETLTRWLSNFADGQRWLTLVGGAARLDDAIGDLYSRPRVLLASGSWLLFSWVLGAGEVWLALYYMGHPVGFLEAVLLESLGRAVRSASFMIPGALGVQEGGFMVLGALLGLGPETGLSISLAKRVRELLLGIPALIVWQAIESRRLWRSRDESAEPADVN